jgi:penicillin-binding protein 1A
VDKKPRRLIGRIAAVALAAAATGSAAILGLYLYLKPGLPDIGVLRDIRVQGPLRIYSRDGKLIASIGDQRRIPVRYDEVPPQLIEAILATEDDRFFEHHGVDWRGVIRAIVDDLRAGRFREGASTITMQLSRDVFLNSRRDMKRKLSEVAIALLMETQFTKQEIFSLYVNKVFLGERAYGVGAAAEVYFGKTLDQLSIAEMATLAGIPAAPSLYNPVASAASAAARRAHVLGRMRELKYISEAEYATAMATPVESRLHGPAIELDAPYVAEMVRNDMRRRYGEDIYTEGYRVYTTIDSRLQSAGTVALRTGLLEYDRRHGWRGATGRLNPQILESADEMDRALGQIPVIGGLRPALVQSVAGKSAKIYVKGLGSVSMPWDRLSWARAELPDDSLGPSPEQASDLFAAGDVIYTAGDRAATLQFVQPPEAQSALVSVDPRDGAIVTLVGGFDFYQSAFNRVTQARRQPGSGFKPFIYAAAFDKGFTPASVLTDAPIVINAAGEETAWRPKDSHDFFLGPVRLREALTRSLNLVTVRLLRDIGLNYTRNYVQRFGFEKSQTPNDLTLALGTAAVSPLQMAVAYSTFANGGYAVKPYLIDRIEDANGHSIAQAAPAIACSACADTSEPAPRAAREPGAQPRICSIEGAAHGAKTVPAPSTLAPRVIRPQVAYLLADMMADVTKPGGTGARARVLNRDDIAGKTGTTNDHHDAWFNGFNGDLVASVWTGFDQARTLGAGEDGAAASLPTWVYFMHAALEGAPRHGVPVPDGIVTARISPQSGLIASADDPNAISEKFIDGNLPKAESEEGAANRLANRDAANPLF